MCPLIAVAIVAAEALEKSPEPWVRLLFGLAVGSCLVFLLPSPIFGLSLATGPFLFLLAHRAVLGGVLWNPKGRDGSGRRRATMDIRPNLYMLTLNENEFTI
ncbi:hypothetical protein FDECE_7225 [Fusarium decemcellulare]|nr:hypothetical protein FDECE_7225 [Fusarium decemcellulare]